MLTHLVATLPGASTDRIVLVAPYDSGNYDEFTFVGANDGASGAAVLLEVARVLAGRALPYTVELVWLEGEGRIGLGAGEERDLRWLGSRTLAERWAETGHLARHPAARLLQPGLRRRPADRARQRLEPRTPRGVLEGGAPARIRRRVPARSRLRIGHLEPRRRSAIAACGRWWRSKTPRSAATTHPEPHAGKEDVLEHCAPDSLQIVGRVAVTAVESIATRLAKIDRFSRTPSVEPRRGAATGEPEREPRSAAGAELPTPERIRCRGKL